MPDPAQPPPPSELEIPFHGQVKKLSLADAAKFAGIGLQDEHRRGELQRLQAELQAKATTQAAQIKVGEELANFARANPAAARTLDSVYTAMAEGRVTPEQVLTSLTGGASSEGQNGAGSPTSGPLDAQTRALLSQMEAKLNGVESAVAERARVDEARSQASKIDEALAADPFLRSHPMAAKIVRDRLSPHVASGLSLSQAVALEVTTFKDALAETQTAERDRLRGQQNLGSVSPSQGIPPVAAPDFSKIDPKLPRKEQRSQMLGAIKRQAMEAAQSLRRGAVSGPS